MFFLNFITSIIYFISKIQNTNNTELHPFVMELCPFVNLHIGITSGGGNATVVPPVSWHHDVTFLSPALAPTVINEMIYYI